jgi:hypothetical protein
MNYSLEQFAADVEKLNRPRLFDTYILPGFLILYAVKSRAAMGRTARRILFTAGIYMLYRNYAQYRAAVASIAAMVKKSDKSDLSDLSDSEMKGQTS